MVNYYIYAKDFSGSTESKKYYHTNGIKTFEQFKSEVKNIEKQALPSQTESRIIYLHWGDKCNEVDEETTVETYNKLQSGKMGTEPETIVKWIKQNYDICGEGNTIKLLYIITDGLIHAGIERCFELNESMQYEKVVFHAFNENLYEIDLSVAASFFKNQCTVYRNNELFDNVDISQDFDYDKITTDNFAAEKVNLKSYVRLKFFKKFKQDALALQEIDKLKKLRDRLFNELSTKLEKNKVNLETKDKKVFLREFVLTNWYKSLNSADLDAKVDIEKSISTLINYIVSDTKSYSFDALKFETKFGNPVEEKPIVDVNFTAEQEIEFPDIILDENKGIPVVILLEYNLLDKIIIHRTEESDEVSPASFGKFKSAMDCPLFLMNDMELSKSVGYFYTLNVYKLLLKNTTKVEPLTRRPFHGGLVLTDTNLFDKYNDYILSATYFDSKKVKFNVGLFYYVLWKNCENKKWMDGLVKEQFKKYVMRRINATVCKIGLTSLPLNPPENVSLPTALWYCIELSSCIFKNDPQNFMHERLRMYYGVAHLMFEILSYLNYDLDHASFVNRTELIKNVMTLKKIPTRREKIYYQLENIFKGVNGFLVSEIEKPFNLRNLNYLKLHHKNMLREEVMEEKVNLNDYVHLMHYVGDVSKPKADRDTVRICKETFRPFFTIGENKSFYTELVEATRKVVINNPDDKDRIKITYEPVHSLEFDRILSLYNLFINCVIDSGKYPTLSEYIEYVSEKKEFKDDLVTVFPPNIYFDIEDIYLRYQNIMTEVNVSDFIKATKNYFNRLERIKAENVMKFNDNTEINEFIANEERKVNLKKNANK